LPEVLQNILIVLAVLVGSSVSSTLGFGFTILISPVLLLLSLDPKTVVVVVNCCILIISSMVLIQSKNHIPIKEITPITIAGLAGVPLGILILNYISNSTLRPIIVILIIILAIISARNVIIPSMNTRITSVLVGVVIGAIVGSTGIGGVLIAILLLGKNYGKVSLRAAISFFSIPIIIISIIGYGVTGLLTQERLLLVLISILPIVLGFNFGMKLLDKIDDKAFRKGVLTLTFVSCGLILSEIIFQLP
jgi:uncharacterized membrane protein YfcA